MFLFEILFFVDVHYVPDDMNAILLYVILNWISFEQTTREAITSRE